MSASDGVHGGSAMFEVLRARHPDVDLVLLPPDQPVPTPPEPPASLEAAEDLAAEGRRVFDRVLHAGGTTLRTYGERWDGRSDGRHEHVTAGSAYELPAADGLPRLRALGDALLALGWDARPAADGSPALAATDGRFLLEAKARDTFLQVELTTPPLHLDVATLDALRGIGA